MVNRWANIRGDIKREKFKQCMEERCKYLTTKRDWLIIRLS
jgi:hypothetical protein